MALTTALYAEVGVAERTHLQLFLPWSATRNRFDELGRSYANVGLGDALMAIQFTPIPAESMAWALRTEGTLPLYDVSEVAPLAGQPPRVPALGDGQVDLTQWVSVGGSLWPLPVYGFVEGGWRYRSSWYYGTGSGQDYGSGPVWRAQAGVQLFDDALLVYATSQGVHTLRDDDVTQQYVTVGPGIAWTVWGGLALEATADAMIWSRNNSPGPTFSVGLSHRTLSNE